MTTSKSRQLAVYLTGTAGAAALLSASQADAAVTAVTFGFGSQFDQSDGTYQFTVGSFGYLKGKVDGSTMYLGYHPGSSVGSGFVYNNGVFAGSGGRGLVKFFANGTVLGDGFTGSNAPTSGPNGVRGYAYFQSNNSQLNLGSDITNQNIGFRTGTHNWGWANVSWNDTTKALTINQAFVESTPNTNITIDTSLLSAAPEPSRALLALAGIAGVALRRRRKQAA